MGDATLPAVISDTAVCWPLLTFRIRGAVTVCEECVPRKFELLQAPSLGILPCPSCATELRETDFSTKTPEELEVEHALQIRRKVKKECVPIPAICMGAQ